MDGYSDMEQIVRIIYKNLWSNFQTYCFQGSLIGVSLMLVYLIAKNLWKRNVSTITRKAFIWKVVLLGMLGFYLCILFEIVLLSRTKGIRYAMNLQLFGTFHGGLWSWIFLIENIILFLPWGVLMTLLWRKFRVWWICALNGFFLSLFIESLQWVLCRGRFEVDDIWCNTLGCMLGFAFSKLGIYFYRMCKKIM